MNPRGAPALDRTGYYFGIGAFFIALGLLALSGFGPRMSATEKLLPHGFCYLWDPNLIRLHVVSDTLIGLAYVAIPISLVTFIRRRTDLPFNWMFLLFGVFIVACGATHWMEVWTLWQPNYWIAGGVKAVTAAASVPTAILLYMLIPHALALPSTRQLREAQDLLETRVRERTAELERANALLRDQRSALEAADRRKDEFLAILSHELRNPVHAIRMAAGVLKMKGGDAETREVSESMERQVVHLSRLLDDLLSVVRDQRAGLQVELERTDLRGVLADALDTVRGQLAQRNQRLEIATPENALWAQADAKRLQQALINLLGNASVYSEPGARIQVSLVAKSGHARISVRDEGIGFEPAETAALFNLFSRSEAAKRKSASGLGIGLHVARQIVEAHGGGIEAVSAGRGKGSEFTLWLPLVD